MKPVLAIPDLHTPFEKAGALEFVRKTKKEFGCGEVVMLGDVADQHALSFHCIDPDGYGPAAELERARKSLKEWHKAFPKAKVCVGNHDARGFRRAFHHGIPKALLRSFGELYKTPKWDFRLRHEIGNVLYIHGTNYSGITAHKRAAERNRQSIVLGHVHVHAGVHYLACPKDLIFGLNAGCLIDVNAYSMEYAKELDTKPVLGCGVVMSDLEAYFVPMNLGTKR